MTTYNYDGVIQVRFAAAITNTAAPTLTEWDNAVDLTPFMRSVNTPLEGQSVDAATAESKYNKTVGGNFGGQNLTYMGVRHREDASDDAWDTLPRETTGFLLCAWSGGTGANDAIQAGDDIDVWPIEVLSRVPTGYTRSTQGQLATFEASMAVPDEPSIDVAVV